MIKEDIVIPKISQTSLITSTPINFRCWPLMVFLVVSFVSFSTLKARELSVNNELYVEISEMIIPIVQRRDVAGFFSITLAVDCIDMAASEKVQKYLPIIRDRFFWDLYVLLGVIWDKNFRTDVTEMKKRLKKRMAQIIGPDQINDILVISFQQHERRNVER